ncbi:MAG: EAL domain-containing protein [Clostridia bacterium]|nr:EAL domain-containing protein [Clostridia bacterium]MBQ8637371.1 EAL domain-containing protein [Clostridia bacterium]
MKRLIAVLLIILVFCTNPAFAEVITTQKTDGYADYVYVAGSPDNYPVEYYDEENNSYNGIIPQLLAKISDRLSTDFVYINGNKSDKNTMGENLQVDIVSSADGITAYGKDYLELLSFEYEGEVKKCGLLFTQIASDEIIARIKTAAAEISADERNGIYLSYASENSKINYMWVIGAVFLLLLLIAFIVLLLLRIKRILKENKADKMTDSETGMGNLQFFKYHFKYTISDISRSLYYISYIILDSSYLRSYHGDSSFDEVLKFTASVLSEHTGDREISARITENGFAFAYQATNDDDAQIRLKEVMNKLNGFADMKEKSNKLVFHGAMYHLAAADKNCEILLFNLRKNCNKIFGTDKQLVCCDIHSMNKIQEEKKITESILKGFENNEFKMYLQFIVDNKTKQIVSAEALSRWDSREKGLIGPGKYIENMEMAGLISRHDFYMFELACRQLENWKGTKYENISLSCNFTRITLSEENFIDKLSMISNGYSFDKSKIAIEITEDAIEKDRDTATKNVMRCKELGFKVYLDDLGSGYTSLANLCDYPIDIVKIDRDILLKTENQKGKDLFSGIIALAHSMNIKVICEGVETEEQNALVSSSACDFVQGWYYSKALPLEECESFIDKHM